LLDGCGGSVCGFEINLIDGQLACDLLPVCDFPETIIPEVQED